MTHALHRCGSVESLQGDYVLLAMTTPANRDVAAPALASFARIVMEADLANYGISGPGATKALGLESEEFARRASESDGVACVFTGKEALGRALALLVEADLGVSITVSGLTEDLLDLLRGLGVKPHSIEMSLGVIGDTGQLEDTDSLDVMTMCGHARISAALVKRGARDVAEGALSAEAASLALGKPCTCGLFNLRRGELLLSQMAEGLRP